MLEQDGAGSNDATLCWAAGLILKGFGPFSAFLARRRDRFLLIDD